MEQDVFINDLKNVLESKTMTTYLRSLSSDAERLRWLQKALYFLVSTRDYESLFLYLLNNNDFTFPDSYMNNKKISEKDKQTIYRDNYLKNGFLYHGTAKTHEKAILENGLYGLVERYGTDFLDDVIKINSLCESIWKMTPKQYQVSQELPFQFLKGKTNQVYLTADISQAFNYLIYNNNWYRNFINNLIFFIGGGMPVLSFDNKQTLINQIESSLNCSKLIMSQNEKKLLIDFIDKYHDEVELSNNLTSKLLVLVKNNIQLNKKFQKVVNECELSKRGIRFILSKINMTDIYASNVPADDLVTLSFNEDLSLSLNIGKGGK